MLCNHIRYSTPYRHVANTFRYIRFRVCIVSRRRIKVKFWVRDRLNVRFILINKFLVSLWGPPGRSQWRTDNRFCYQSVTGLVIKQTSDCCLS